MIFFSIELMCLLGLLSVTNGLYDRISKFPINQTVFSTIPTDGRIWPKPRLERDFDMTFFVLDRNKFTIRFDSKAMECEILQKSASRFQNRIFPKIYGSESRDSKSLGDTENDVNYVGKLTEVLVRLGEAHCETHPHQSMNEMYSLEINVPEYPGKAEIIAGSVWGALRGLESFSQAVYINNAGQFAVNSTRIMDYPRFSYRGVMIDSSRHFLTTSVIKTNIDLMEMNKFNVLHWHLVDDQSFPYVSKKFPKLSKMGAYDSRTHVYRPSEIQDIIEYARIRGIRVIPEFDTPGHTQSWEAGQPGLLTKCYSSGRPNGFKGPIDPTLNSSYAFMSEFFGEVASVFPDEFVHLGGDEVSFDCWKSNPKIRSFMNARKLGNDYSKLESYYMEKLLKIVEATDRQYIVWNEVFDNKNNVTKDAIIQVWTGNAMAEMAKVTEAGLRTILSEGWYMNYISYGSDWVKYYKVEPQNFKGTEEQMKLVLGGEACIWGEFVNSINITPRLWPRASAVAERLWSDKSVLDINKAASRLQEHECRMLRRGYPVEPVIGPGYCKFTWN